MLNQWAYTQGSLIKFCLLETNIMALFIIMNCLLTSVIKTTGRGTLSSALYSLVACAIIMRVAQFFITGY